MKTENKEKSTSRQYRFGTFDERIDHICLLFDTAKPALEYKENDPYPQITDSLVAWIEQHEICMDWLFVGNPDGLLRLFAERRNSFGYMVEQVAKLKTDDLVILRDKLKDIQATKFLAAQHKNS